MIILLRINSEVLSNHLVKSCNVLFILLNRSSLHLGRINTAKLYHHEYCVLHTMTRTVFRSTTLLLPNPIIFDELFVQLLYSRVQVLFSSFVYNLTLLLCFTSTKSHNNKICRQMYAAKQYNVTSIL